MIKVIPKWVIFREGGGYWVGYRLGGMMEWGPTIEQAKRRLIRELDNETFQQYQHRRSWRRRGGD